MLVVLTLALATAGRGAETAPAAGGGSAPTYRLDLAYDYGTRYAFRGLDLLAGRPVHSGEVTAVIGPVSVYWFGYYGELASSASTSVPYDEHDLGFEYAFTTGPARVTLGAVSYRSTNVATVETKELYASAGLAALLQPKLTVAWDFEEYDAGYASLELSHELALGRGFTVAGSASYGYSLGWTTSSFGGERSRLPNDVTASLDLGWTHRHLRLHAMLQHSWALAALEEVDQEDLTAFSTGLRCTF